MYGYRGEKKSLKKVIICCLFTFSFLPYKQMGKKQHFICVDDMGGLTLDH